MIPILSESEISELEASIQGIEITTNGLKKVYELKKNDLSNCELFLFNNLIILNIYGYDTIVFFKNLGAAKSKLEAKLMARYLALVLYEFGRDISKMLGKKFKGHIKDHFNEDHFNNELKIFNKQLNDFKKKYETIFYEVRNNVAAHRDEDPHLQIKIIEKIKINTYYESSMFFIKFNEELFNFFVEVLKKIETQRSN